MKFIIPFLIILISTTSQAYEKEPTKQDLIDFYSVMKLLYSDMPPFMNGMGILIEADFDLNNIKDMRAICDFIQATERMKFVASNAKIHPVYKENLKDFDKMKDEDMTRIKKEIAHTGYSCI